MIERQQMNTKSLLSNSVDIPAKSTEIVVKSDKKELDIDEARNNYNLIKKEYFNSIMSELLKLKNENSKYVSKTEEILNSNNLLSNENIILKTQLQQLNLKNKNLTQNYSNCLSRQELNNFDLDLCKKMKKDMAILEKKLEESIINNQTIKVTSSASILATQNTINALKKELQIKGIQLNEVVNVNNRLKETQKDNEKKYTIITSRLETSLEDTNRKLKEVEEREALLKETIKSDMQRLSLFELQAAENRDLQYMPRRT